MAAEKVAAIGSNGEFYEWDSASEQWIISDGIIIKSPNGTLYKIVVGDLGTLNTQQV